MLARYRFFTAAPVISVVASLLSCSAPVGRGENTTASSPQLPPASSYFDRAERSRLLSGTKDPVLLKARRPPRPCDVTDMPEPVGILKIPSFYGDPAGYAKADAPLRRFQNFVTEMAEFYVVTGDATYARCAAEALAKWAERNALLDFSTDGNRQSWYNAVWTTVSAGFAYSIVRDAPGLSDQVRETIDIWLGKITRKHIGIAGGKIDCCNNHAHWRGLEAAIVGIALGDRRLFMHAVQAYRSALASMNADGSFPLEMERGERATHYQNFAILPLVYIAELAHRQKVDLYNASASGKTLHRAITFLLGAIDNPAAVKTYTDRVQDLSFLDHRGELNWMEPYQARFPDERIAAILAARRPIFHRYGGGNSTLYFFSPDR